MVLQERGPPNLGFGNMTGGYMTGGAAGTLKMTIPTAFTISMLAWSMLEFPPGKTSLRKPLDCPIIDVVGSAFCCACHVHLSSAASAVVLTLMCRLRSRHLYND